MQLISTITAFGLMGSLALAVPAPEPTTAGDWIVDPAAATNVPEIPIDPAEAALVPADSNAAALGKANVRNNCNFPVYLYVCGQHPATCTAERKIAANTGTFSETYSTINNGRSIKIGRRPGEVQKPILQFEYTHTNDGRVAYDVSNVDGNPFASEGFSLTSTSAQCPQKHCGPPVNHNNCPYLFTKPKNGKVLYCGQGQSIGVSLCNRG
ncbi:MAG: hypothetical protein LQ351_004334 [Letrouitia transgressa]|nr:MAG: hypothetical protein LQ351_004334 [Letrouitia transgressa]